MTRRVKPAVETVTETINELRNIRLIGTQKLLADSVTSVYEVTKMRSSIGYPTKIISREVIDTKVEEKCYPLRLITVEELAKLRREQVPSFVLKDNGFLYHTVIPADSSFLSSKIMSHQCATAGKDCCGRLSAAPDSEGGCAKVRGKSTGIEQYPWISGFETFGTKLDTFVVRNCTHYEPCTGKKKLSPQKLENLNIAVSQFFLADTPTLQDMRNHMHLS